MPHVHVYLYPGRSPEQKQAVTQRIVAAIQEEMGVDPKWISVAFQEVLQERWEPEVVQLQIRNPAAQLTHPPGYLNHSKEET